MPSRGPRTLTSTKEKAKALQECYNDLLAGHFGARRTLEKLQRCYTQKGMRKDVEAYCKDCLICKRLTPIQHKLYRLLAPLLPLNNAQEEVIIDFVTELPLSCTGGQVYNAILVVVCRLTKIAYYIPARTDQDGTDLAQAQIREVIRLHRVLKTILSNRGLCNDAGNRGL